MEIKKNFLASFLIGILALSTIIPAYSEVQSFQSDKSFYKNGDKIIFSGTVDEESSGLVTIVIRDSNDEFVLLTQAFINFDNTFERSVDINEKFSINGIYNATAFLVNMTEGSVLRFDFSKDGSPISPSVSQSAKTSSESSIKSDPKPSEPETVEPSMPSPVVPNFINPAKGADYYLDRYYNEPEYKKWFDENFPDYTIEEAIILAIPDAFASSESKSDIQNYFDQTLEAKYYIDRYNNEPEYKRWFDENFPDYTIYDVVGIEDPELVREQNIPMPASNKSSPLKQDTSNLIENASVSPTTSKNSELGQMLLALGGLGVLFGAVYGVKRRVDTNSEKIESNNVILQKKVANNSEQISQNRFWLKKKLLNLKSNDEPISVIKDRLAKGEITIDEYYRLLRALKK